MTWPKSRTAAAILTWAVSLGLAVLASSWSLRIAIEAGHRLGSSPDERQLLAGGGIVAVLSAHLLGSIFSRASVWPRLGAIVLWVICAGFVAYLHTSFFLSVQEQAGARRMADVASADVFAGGYAQAPRRGVSLVLAELANVKADQARLWSRPCREDCSRFEARAAFLNGRIAALDAEADEVRRWVQGQDRLEARRAAVGGDPVTVRLAAVLRVPGNVTGLVIGLLFAIILEGTGSLCWYVVLQRRELSATGPMPVQHMQPAPVLPPVTAASQAVTQGASSSTVPADDLLESGIAPGSEINAQHGKVLQLAERVRPEIEAGRVRLNVTDIREFLHCARATAAQVRRALDAE